MSILKSLLGINPINYTTTLNRWDSGFKKPIALLWWDYAWFFTWKFPPSLAILLLIVKRKERVVTYNNQFIMAIALWSYYGWNFNYHASYESHQKLKIARLAGLGSSFPLIFCIHVRSRPIYWENYLPCKKDYKVMLFYM